VYTIYSDIHVRVLVKKMLISYNNYLLDKFIKWKSKI
jgi:hypothetical protein